MEQLAFGLVAAVLLYSALRVVSDENLVHTVLWLGVTLATTAAAYVLLHAPFLAAIQIILYTGGALTLMLFGVMLTQRVESVEVPNAAAGQGRAAVVAALLFGVIAAAVVKTPGLPDSPPIDVPVRALGKSFLTTHLLAFEVLSVLLLTAMVGAIVLARKADPAPEPTPEPKPEAHDAHGEAHP